MTATPIGSRTRSKGGRVTSRRQASFTVPTLSADTGAEVAAVLQHRLVALSDLALTLRHIHWNVVGPHFVAVHQMLDPQYAGVAQMVDTLAERIATLGAVPTALPGAIVEARRWDDYDLGRADSMAHLGALDLVYVGVITDHRAAIEQVSDSDPVSEDLLVGQTALLEQYQWFVRSHLADWAGGMANAGATSELAAARAVADKTPGPARRSRPAR